jgi:serine/threonine protein kinase
MWGIGAVLFEAATGEPAFDDPDVEELDDAESDTPSDVSDAPDEESDEPYESDDAPTGERFQQSDFPQLSTTARRADALRPLPRKLADLIATCLQPLPERRPGVPELLQALELIAGLPASERRFARPPG